MGTGLNTKSQEVKGMEWGVNNRSLQVNGRGSFAGGAFSVGGNVD